MKSDNVIAQTAQRCKLTPLERKVARVIFADNGGRTMTFDECAARVGASNGWVYRAWNNLMIKTMRLYWQKPESKGRGKHEK